MASVGRSNFRKTLNNLVHVHRVNEDCDDLICRYSQFIDEVAQPQCSVFYPYRDTFLHDRMSKQEPYGKLWILLISQGQVSVE